MSDAGEGLIDAESRIAERMEELERERRERSSGELTDPEARRIVESLKLARKQFERQLETTTHEVRRRQLSEALAEVERKLAEAQARL
jgi:hypothetical protein